MPQTVQAWVALGANLGDAKQTILDATEKLAQLPQSRLVASSSLYRTAPIDSSGPDYLNAVACIETSLNPLTLLDQLQSIENEAGRLRPYRNAPRTLDLDLLLYGQLKIDHPRLQVPHPRMFDRAFVLVPLHEISPELVTAAKLNAVTDQQIERCEFH